MRHGCSEARFGNALGVKGGSDNIPIANGYVNETVIDAVNVSQGMEILVRLVKYFNNIV